MDLRKVTQLDFRIAAPSVVRFCNNTQHKVLFCVICNGFDPACFSSSTPTESPISTLSTKASSETVATDTTPITAATEPAE
ncbi:hypothetical protein MSG28_013129 [Choristoneura fumiferana]|uniref:Uncharacterized protein n=1 Tax=Choristoneura fumiferana TaxID=7141 RepID=A0ACC0KT03_CHOFU|nr:hypothetical protein MSG28_013129 [Choristoneura fumiferana]